MTWVSTRFFGQPSETKWTFMRRKRASLARSSAREPSGENQHGARAQLGDQPINVAPHEVAPGHQGVDLGAGEDLVGRPALLGQNALQRGGIDALQRVVQRA